VWPPYRLLLSPVTANYAHFGLLVWRCCLPALVRSGKNAPETYSCRNQKSSAPHFSVVPVAELARVRKAGFAGQPWSEPCISSFVQENT
jgi:hypothetical protein